MMQLEKIVKPREMIANMNAATMADIVSRAQGQTTSVTAWQVASLGNIDSSIQPASGGVYRVWGSGTTTGALDLDWYLVVKILKSPAGFTMPSGLRITQEIAEDPASFGYWRREALAAQSNLLADLPGELAAPRYLAVTDLEDMIWLWQEEVQEDGVWSWSDYRKAAYQLGMWQGQYASGERLLPQEPWLTDGWLRQWVNLPLKGIMGLLEQINGWAHSLVRSYFTAAEVAQLQDLWAERQVYLEALSTLPKTLCHMDAYRSNLFWQDGKLRLIDWAFTGPGAVGEELAAFIGGTLLLGHVAVAEAEELEAVALEGYLAGLRDAGWGRNGAEVELAYRWAMPLRYALMSLASMLRAVFDQDYARDWQTASGKALPALLQHRAGLIRFMLTRLCSAR